MPPRASSADLTKDPSGGQDRGQTVEQMALRIQEFLAAHPKATVLEDGKVIFDLHAAKATLSTEHGRCTLHLWSEERNLVRQVASVSERAGTLRLATLRFGQRQTKLLELCGERERRSQTTRETARQRYARTLERVLERQFAPWKPEGLRTAMDLERGFGPAYTRGMLVMGNAAWAVIGVNEQESAATVDGILAPGILWLDHCRAQAGGRRLYQGLKVVTPRGGGTLTGSRMAWLNSDAAKWELWELDEQSEELTALDVSDQGNVRTRLVHLADEQAGMERFAAGVEQVMALVPAAERARVELRLRNPAELAFLLHGLEFARVRMDLEANSFARRLEVHAGVGEHETVLTEGNRERIATLVRDLFERRRVTDAKGAPGDAERRRQWMERGIGSSSSAPAHARVTAAGRGKERSRMRDPLFRAAPERWLESVLRRDLTPLTRTLAPKPPTEAGQARGAGGIGSEFANELDPDTIGNRAEPGSMEGAPEPEGNRWPAETAEGVEGWESQVIPRLDPRHVYSQVSVVAGAGDRGLLDLLGVTADGRLAVIELKVDDDLQFALQGLDYWVRVRHHHRQSADQVTGMGEFQRHGYFRGVELSPLEPRLYLVAPSLHIHPATEKILGYFSPRVEWSLLALDERWRQQIRVVWRKQSGRVGRL
ncbi:MAG: hypothetical protein ACP5E5_14320 [Acidobacteriaceae bacterium]